MNKFYEAKMFFEQVRFFPDEFGYKLTGTKQTRSQLFGTRLAAVYSSVLVAREVHFYYSPGLVREPESFAIFIDKGVNDSVQVTEHLKDLGLDEIISKFRNDDPSRNTLEFCMNFAGLIFKLSKNELFGLLSGKEWDVKPFDWSPYR